ncbi:MAG: FtsX-like permease family protein [Burkholderiales bacterium]|nr:FtsX-like permease family protein [Burkholderiales bacterium]
MHPHAPPRFPLARAVFLASWRQTRGRTVLCIVGIALGVALGVAIDIINRAALAEFTRANRALGGSADIEIRTPRGASPPGGGFSEALYPQIARMPQVVTASPVIDAYARVAGQTAEDDPSVRILGIDPFRAARLQPALALGLVAADGGNGDGGGNDTLSLLQTDAIVLHPAAARAFALATGDTLTLQVGSATIALDVIGISAFAPDGGGVMDIAGAQWRLQRLGRLDRIDVQLQDGVDADDFLAAVSPMLPAGVHAATARQSDERAASASRAYRVNLNMLALIALFTGGFVIFSTQALAVVRRRTQFAVLRALGLERGKLVRLLLVEGALIGGLGAVCGVALGFAAAHFGLQIFGDAIVETAGGFARGAEPQARIAPLAAAGFAALGIAVAVFGSLVAALDAGSVRPAVALHAGAEQTMPRRAGAAPGLALLAAGVLAALMPAVQGLPWFGYAAIALILFGAIALLPQIAVRLFDIVPIPSRVEPQLALARLRNASGDAVVSLATLLISFSLIAAMAIMVASFRGSLGEWLAQALPADLYLHAGRGADTVWFDFAQQQRISALPGVAGADFLTVRNLALDPTQPTVALIARDIEPANAGSVIPLRSPALTPPKGATPVWISEAVADLYGHAPGDFIELPIAGRTQRFFVAGVWRDYARQHGAIVVARDVYSRLTGDTRANQAALWLAPGSAAEAVTTGLAEVLGGASFEIRTTAELRARSLALFDRTFTITYVLEAIAIAIGLFGVANGFSAAMLARRREFGVLRHLGMLRRQIIAMLGIESALLAALGAIAGIALGFVISLILIHVVNRQSFHWSMELHLPWLALTALAAALIAAATLTAVITARRAMSSDVINAVREDW